MSRPKQEIVKDKIFKMRFTESEFNQLKRISNETNKPISKIIREALGDHGMKTIIDHEQVKRTLKRREKQLQFGLSITPITCAICGKRLYSKDAEEIEYIKNTIGQDKYYHSDCLKKAFKGV